MNREEFTEFLASETRSQWSASQNPLYLADIPSLLREKASLDYKEIIGDQRLKGFAEETAGSGSYKVVKHEFQKAKIGLIPPEEDFEFPGEITASFGSRHKQHDEIKETPAHRVTLDFIRAISNLTPEEQASIIIPTNVIVKLLNKK